MEIVHILSIFQDEKLWKQRIRFTYGTGGMMKLSEILEQAPENKVIIDSLEGYFAT